MSVLYRTESFSGSGERSAATVMSFEIFELMNTDILDTLSSGILCKYLIANKMRELSEKIQSSDSDLDDLPEYDTNAAIEFCENILAAVKSATGVDVRYALWLTSKEKIAAYYGKDMDSPTDYSAYEIGPVILSGECDDGTLYGYTELPQPLNIPLDPIVVTNAEWAV